MVEPLVLIVDFDAPPNKPLDGDRGHAADLKDDVRILAGARRQALSRTRRKSDPGER